MTHHEYIRNMSEDTARKILELHTREGCECSDPGCPCHNGCQCHFFACTTLYRVDMVDETGTRMCEGCADDALSSGLFTDEKP